RWLVREATRHMIQPSFFMVTTTMVGFASLVVSDIRPVIDFGWMMTIGIMLALVAVYLIVPSILSVLPNGPVPSDNPFTQKITLAFASFTEQFYKPLLIFMAMITAISFVGIGKLTVENRFIDYFKDDTEIHQGMLLIDRKLGGTTPLDIVINAPKDAANNKADDPFADDFSGNTSADFDDPFADDFDAPTPSAKAKPRLALEDAYWYTPQRLKQLVEIQQWLSDHPHTGKVL